MGHFLNQRVSDSNDEKWALKRAIFIFPGTPENAGLCGLDLFLRPEKQCSKLRKSWS